MSVSSEPDPITKTVRTGQLVSVALTSSLLTFMVVVLVIRSRPSHAPAPGGSESQLLTYAALGLTVLTAPGMMVLPGQAISAARKRIAAELPKQPAARFQAFLPLFETWLVVGSALLEAAGCLCLVAYLVEGSPVVLFLSMLMLGGLVMRFPTQSAVERWVEEQMQQRDGTG